MSFDVQQFHNILRVTRDKLRASPPLSKLSSTKRTLIAADLVLVAASIRTGYLVDAISAQDAPSAYASLLHSLCQIHPIFDSLLIIHESSSDQTFFIHARLALGKLKRILGTVAAPNTSHPTHQSGFLEVTFVSPGPEPPEKCAMPSDLRRILEYVTSRLDARISGDWDDSQPVIQLPESHASTMIPLAAVLLEYPVAYAPPPDPASLTFLVSCDSIPYSSSLAPTGWKKGYHQKR
ncbi:Poxc laccase transcription factor [Pleurotus pulmonarius]